MGMIECNFRLYIPGLAIYYLTRQRLAVLRPDVDLVSACSLQVKKEIGRAHV